jgi:methyltransferase
MFLLIERIVELRLARKNAIWLKERGAIEVGRGHYPLFLVLHTAFFIGILIESIWRNAQIPAWWWLPFSLFVLAQGLRFWAIASLGRYWNTRIFVLPNHPLQRKGPYRWLKHPNYVAVMLELISFPLIFGAYVTAIVISFLHLLLLVFWRIPLEEKALANTNEHPVSP